MHLSKPQRPNLIKPVSMPANAINWSQDKIVGTHFGKKKNKAKSIKNENHLNFH